MKAGVRLPTSAADWRLAARTTRLVLGIPAYGALGAGCAACGSAILVGMLSLLGVAGAATRLPLDGLEFALLAIVALLLSIFWIADGMRGSEIRGCPLDLPGA